MIQDSWSDRVAPILFLLTVACFIGSGTAYGLDGLIRAGVYSSPGGHFRVPVPEMRNPFIKHPSNIRDHQRLDGGEEVNFIVTDLGEAWRFGVRSLGKDLTADNNGLKKLCDEELGRWPNASGKAQVIMEKSVQLEDSSGIARIYYVESASILFVDRTGATPERDSAIIGVISAISAKDKRASYVVGQFDMPNKGGFYGLDTERGRKHLAKEHLTRMQEMAALLRLSQSPLPDVYISPHHIFSIKVPKLGSPAGPRYLITPLDTGGDSHYDKVMFHADSIGDYLIASARLLPDRSLAKMEKDSHRTVLRNISEASLMGWRYDLDNLPKVRQESFIKSQYGEAIVRDYLVKKGTFLSRALRRMTTDNDNFDTHMASIVARRGALVVYVLMQNDGNPADVDAHTKRALELFSDIKVIEE